MIEVGDSIAKVKLEINNILAAVGVAPAVSWGDAHTKLNLLGAGLTTNMGGEEAREKINALFDGPAWAPEGVDLYVDFQNNRYYDGWIRALDQYVTDTHATDILALGSTGYETFAPNVLPRIDLGLLTTVGRTNIVARSNNFSSSAWVKNNSTVSDDGVTNGPFKLWRCTRDGGVFGGPTQLISMSTGVTYTASILIKRIDGGESRFGVYNSTTITWEGYATIAWGASGAPTVTAVGGLSASIIETLADDVYRIALVFVFNGTTGDSTTIQFHANRTTDLTSNYAGQIQLEEGTFATDPIITEGSAVTRPGNMPRLEGLDTAFPAISQGVGGVIDVDVLSVFNSRLLMISDGGETEQLRLDYSDGNLRFVAQKAGPSYPAVLTLGAPSAGRTLICFAAYEDFFAARLVGGSQQTDTSGAFPVGMHTLGIGGTGYTATNNSASRWKRLAFKFGPQDQTSFDAMYALAQEWEAQ